MFYFSNQPDVTRWGGEEALCGEEGGQAEHQHQEVQRQAGVSKGRAFHVLKSLFCNIFRSTRTPKQAPSV